MTEENNTIDTAKTELTAGEMLRNARVMGRRKREIQTVAKQLCIREEFLQALEDGNYTVIPEVVYILGFARNYAIELGLDPDEVVAKIKREMHLVPDVPLSADDDVRRDVSSRSAKTFLKNGVFETVRNFMVRRWKWVIGGLVAVVLVVVAGLLVFGGGDTPDVPSELPSDMVVATAPTVAEPEYRNKVRERFGVENRETANVVIQATTESWVKIEDARGKTVFSRVLVPGDVYFVPAGDKYKGTFGNAGGVDVWVNGELAPAIGDDHARVNGISMAPDSLMKKSE